MGIDYMFGTYDYRVTALAIVVAILASYTALDLVGRVSASRTRDAYAWLAAGAVCMGTGIWSMHFIGMLAFELPIEMGYDFEITALSWVMAVIASSIALLVASRSQMSRALDPRRRVHGGQYRGHALHRHGRHAQCGRSYP